MVAQRRGPCGWAYSRGNGRRARLLHHVRPLLVGLRGGRDSRRAHTPPAAGVARLVSRLALSGSRGHAAASLGGRRLPRLALARGRGEAVEGCGGCAGGLEEEEDACPQVH